MRKVSRYTKFLFFIFDILGIYLSFSISFYLRFYSGIFPVIKGIPSYSGYLRALPLVILVWLVVFWQVGIYRKLHYDFVLDFFNVLKAVILSLIITVALGFFYREFSYSRLVAIIMFFIAPFIIALIHTILKYILKNFFRIFFYPARILILGEGRLVRIIRNRFKKQHRISLIVKDKISKEKVRDIIKKRKIEEVIVCFFPIEHSYVLDISDVCEEEDIYFSVVPDILELRLGDLAIDTLLGIPVLHLKPTSLSGINLFLKDIFDIFASIFIISIFLIPFLIVSYLIKIDSEGPVFFWQYRMGKKGKIFKFVKFRSMYKDADKKLDELKNKSDRRGPVFKMKNDPRVTRVGKYLRKFSLDEFPQLWNVLKGEMSLIGPRPQVLWEAEAYDKEAKRRLRIKPGITGLWQISGRAELPYEEMIKLDLFYVQNWSWELDFMIITKTIPTVLFQKGAY